MSRQTQGTIVLPDMKAAFEAIWQENAQRRATRTPQQQQLFDEVFGEAARVRTVIFHRRQNRAAAMARLREIEAEIDSAATLTPTDAVRVMNALWLAEQMVIPIRTKI
jgi:hypothetical protein